MSESRPKTLRKPRSYLSRREGWRLLLMCGSLGLIATLMAEAGKPANYTWLFGALQEEGQPATDVLSAASPSPGAVSPETKKTGRDGKYFAGVKPELLDLVRDDTTFRNDERYAWFNLLGVLQKTPAIELEKASLGRVTYFQLFGQTNEYRGKLVTIRGRVHRAMPAAAPDNRVGIEKYFQLVVQPDDAPGYPIIVYCLELPEGFPTGMKIFEGAEITGFYFKRWPYKAQDALRTAPTLAAKNLRWIEIPPEQQPPVESRPMVIVLVAVGAFAVILAVFLYSRTRRGTLPRPEPAPALGSLRDLDRGPDKGWPADTSAQQQDDSSDHK